MNYERIKFRVKKLTQLLEFILALFIAVSVLIGMVDLIRYLVIIFQTNPTDTYAVFQRFLGHVLLLVVGVELVVMLVFHSPSSVIEVLMYAVARKMLIGNEHMYDFIFGIAAIAAIFAIRKFLFVEEIAHSHHDSHNFSAAASVKAINEALCICLPEDSGNTIGGLLSKHARSACVELTEGLEFNISKVKVRILKVNDGVIEKVSIMRYLG